MRWEFFKDLWKMLNWSQKFRWKFFFIKIFLILYCNVNTFRIIHNKWKYIFRSFPQSLDDAKHVRIHSMNIKYSWPSRFGLYVCSLVWLWSSFLGHALYNTLKLMRACIGSGFTQTVYSRSSLPVECVTFKS